MAWAIGDTLFTTGLSYCCRFCFGQLSNYSATSPEIPTHMIGLHVTVSRVFKMLVPNLGVFSRGGNPFLLFMVVDFYRAHFFFHNYKVFSLMPTHFLSRLIIILFVSTIVAVSAFDNIPVIILHKSICGQGS